MAVDDKARISDIRDINKAFIERKVVVLNNTMFSNSYGNWLDSPYSVEKVLQSFTKENLKLTKDSLIDFSDRT